MKRRIECNKCAFYQRDGYQDMGAHYDLCKANPDIWDALMESDEPEEHCKYAVNINSALKEAREEWKRENGSKTMNNKYVIKEILKMGFKYSGVKGVYVLDRIAFKGKFDEDGNNDWEKSSGKKKLQEWAEKNLTKEILEQFEVDIPTAEEVFSQNMLNLYDASKKLKSKQFPIFRNSDNRMKEFEGNPRCWWTRSTSADHVLYVLSVYADGGECSFGAHTTGWFVPVLRKKKLFIKRKTVLA